MASYISSSDAEVPYLNWTRIFGIAFVMLMVCVGTTETLLHAKGFAPTVVDSQALWVEQRERASQLGDRALILVGASRIQLGLDLNVLRQKTGLEPVQLAIDGSSYVPVLNGLARDATIKGTIILDLMPGPVSIDIGSKGTSKQYQHAYETVAAKHVQWPAYQTAELWLTGGARDFLTSYANGGRPWDSLLNRIFNATTTSQYLLTFPDRSRKADYQRVPMPDFYLSRVLRHLGNPPDFNTTQQGDDLQRQLMDYIAKLRPKPENSQSKKGLADLEQLVSTIQSRGGRVIILAMPTSGLVQEADDRQFPRHLYWDKVVASTTAQTIHWQDYQSLSGFNCPDGSHLDAKDTVAFTDAFALVADLKRHKND